MPKLYGREKEYCKRGHELEVPAAKRLLREGRENEIVKIFKTGLVQKKEQPHEKTTIDFVAIKETSDGDRKLIGVEMKARLRNKTLQAQQERARLQALHLSSGSSSQKYFTLKARDPEIRSYIKSSHEIIQILHHAYVYNFDEVMLVAVDDSGGIVMGVTVSFDDELKSAYGNVLRAIVKFSMSFVYRVGTSTTSYRNTSAAGWTLDSLDPVDRRCFRRALQSMNIPEDAFVESFKLWKAFRRLKRPLPRSARIIPLLFSVWNAFKGGSDTITKIMDSVPFMVPTVSSTKSPAQAKVVGRQLLTLFVPLLRLYQIGTAPKDLDEYETLLAWQESASKRCTFRQILQIFKNYLLRKVSRGPDTRQLLQTPQQSTEEEEHRIDGIAAVQTFGCRTTGSTPKRAPIKTLYGKLNPSHMDQYLKRRHESCTGVMCYRLKPGSVLSTTSSDENALKGTCFVCGAETPYFCAGCHHYYCCRMSSNRTKMQNKENVVATADTGGNGRRRRPQSVENLQLAIPFVKKRLLAIPYKENSFIFAENTCYLAGHQ
mmetsp:Transcript_7145/g.10465  ORF Transcript_7145/g.10465 Transcript_7145/m.10465 type:complete len:544 (+) Transcript_7145:549-2180(+)